VRRVPAEHTEDTEKRFAPRGKRCCVTAMNDEAKRIIEKLGLEPLPDEGGWFRRTWQTPETVSPGRAAWAVIYFLVTPEDFSALHRLETDEIWLFHAGDTLEHVMLNPADGAITVTGLGGDVLAGEKPQVVVTRGVWQGARLATGGTRGWALVSCSMAPQWVEHEFALGAREALTREFPAAHAQIAALTR
jgi:predicted cupin superfamily sugar epimerase